MIDRANESIVSRKLSQIWNSTKERYIDWRIDAANDRISKKETELDFLRVKGAAMEAKAGMMHSRDVAEYEEKANQLIDFYQGEIACELSLGYVPVVLRLLSLMTLILAEVALWIGLLYLVPAIDLPEAVLLILAFVALVAIAVICDIPALWLANRLSDAYLRLRIKKIRRYLATIGWNKK